MKNNNIQFSITGIDILSDCHYLKVLKPGYYAFNEWCKETNGKIEVQQGKNLEKYFFGKNISVQAIVGKNGSGKSAILELMYRMINNLGCLITKNSKRKAADVLYFVDNIFADLHFIIGNEKGTLYCRNRFVGFRFSKYKVYYGDKNSDSIFKGFKDYNNVKSSEIIEFTKNFFYTIVTNYSIQAFIGNDYRNEARRAENENQSIEDTEAIWIDSLFHKNDGYIAPIVLNPYRDSGKLNLNTEYQLTNSRLASILIESLKNNKQFIENYELHDIEYSFNRIWMVEKYSKIDNRIKSFEDLRIHFISSAYEERTFSHIILQSLGYNDISPKLNDVKITAYAYLVYKILNIASKYPSYINFEHIGDVKDYNTTIQKASATELKELVKEIKKDKSHITLKIRQTLNFINNESTDQLKESFTYLNYENLIKNKRNSHKGLYTIMEFLPPPFFSFDIKLDKVEKGKIISKKPISFQSMSAGERQYIYTITTFVYHIKNILSIQQSQRIKYRRINLVLDEVEICFHPEYQRQFVYNLINTIRRLKLNTYCSYNIIIATHSPFILSDIPKSNILYLEKGRAKDKSLFENPFGANINEILKQSFFLDKGFVGEFAKNKINSLLDYLTLGRKGDWTEDSSMEFINMIEDLFMKQQLMALYRANIKTSGADVEIRRLEHEIEKLKKQGNDKNTNY